MPDINQLNLIRSLQQTSVYPHETDRLQMIETHISWVFLCGPYAYKIKKSLNLGFVDFSTLDKRKHYCEEELRLNGRLAPELYLAVVPITGTPEQPELEGSGETFEYAVKMRRFSQESLLNSILEQRHLTDVHISQIITQVADFHQIIPVAAADTDYGHPHHVAAPAQQNFVQMRKLFSDTPQRLELLELMRIWAEQELQSCYEQFARRKRMGFIRECHGDMHLGNMAAVDGRVVIFDGIEFNPDLYWIDVMSEVAFIYMDLEYHEKKNFACQFLNGYLDRTGDYQGLQVLRFYLWHRAMVRAKVASIRSVQEVECDLPSSSSQEIERYLQLAHRYTQPQGPALLITHGLSGSGKSTLSRPLVEPLAAIRIRADRERQRMFGKGKRHGEAATISGGVYSEDATRQTYGKLVELGEAVLRSGFNVIIDATSLERHQREVFKQLAGRLGVPFRILHFHAADDVLRQRIRHRQRDGDDISEADLSVLEHQLAAYVPLDEDELGNTVTIDTELVSESEQILALVNQSLSTRAAEQKSSRQKRG